MKIQIIGDIHGLSSWKDIVDLTADKIVFLGDYTDSFTHSNVEILQNLVVIVEFKNHYTDKVILLWGNHDYPYSLPIGKADEHRCTGYRPEMHWDLYDVFNKNRDKFQLAYQYENHLFTHAGVHAGWYDYYALPEIFELGADNISISEQLNELFKWNKPSIFMTDFHRGGFNKTGGPLWLSKQLSYTKPLNGYHQYVGHTHTEEPKYYKKGENTSIMYCDCLEKYTEPIILNL